MNSKKYLLGCSALAGTIMALPASSFAQQPQTSQAQISGIEEIVVTSRRREENLQSVPIAIAAFSAGMLEDRNIKRFEEIAQHVPNLVMGSMNRPNNARVFIRGIGGGDTFAYRSFGVAIYVDGMYFADSLGAYNAAFDVERIEVLRGPQGTLFGKNTTGGAIVVVSKKPGPDPETTFQFDYGRYNYRRAKAATNVVLIPDELFMRMGVNYEKDDGYYKELNSGEGYSDIENRTGKLALRWLPTEDWTVDVGGYWSWEPRHMNGGNCKFLGSTAGGKLSDKGAATPDQILQTSCNATAAAGPYKFYSDVPGFADTESAAVNFRSEWAPSTPVLGLDNFSAAFATGFRYTGYNFGSDVDYTETNLQFQGLDYKNAPGGRTNKTFSAEVLLNGDAADDRLHLTGGAYYFTDYSGQQGQDCFKLYMTIQGTGQSKVCNNPGSVFFTTVRPTTTPPGAALGFNIYSDNWSAASFANATFDVTDALKVEMGGRITKDHRTSRQLSYNYTQRLEGLVPIISDATIVGDAVSSTLDYSKFTWKGSVSYQIGDIGAVDDANFYASIAKGFNAGGTNTEGGEAVLSVFPTYDPEVVTTYEIGVKTTWADSRVRVNAAIFQSDFNNKQQIVNIDNSSGVLPGDPSIQTTLNIARQRIKGAELEATISPVDNMLLEASGSYLKNRFRGNATTDIPANLLPLITANFGPNTNVPDMTPPWRLNMAASYTMEMPNGWTVTPRINVAMQDDFREVPSTLNESRKLNPLTGQRGSCYDPGPTKIDGRLTFDSESKSTSVAIYGTNLTDEVVRIACSSGVVNATNLPSGNGIYTEVRDNPMKWGVTTIFRF